MSTIKLIHLETEDVHSMTINFLTYKRHCCIKLLTTVEFIRPIRAVRGTIAALVYSNASVVVASELTLLACLHFCSYRDS